jgi:hypothetical protein
MYGMRHIKFSGTKREYLKEKIKELETNRTKIP